MRAVIVCALMAVTVVMTVGVVVMMVVMVATPCAVVVAVVVATPCAEGAEGKEHEHGSFDSFEERLIFGNRNSRSREVEAKIARRKQQSYKRGASPFGLYKPARILSGC